MEPEKKCKRTIFQPGEDLKKIILMVEEKKQMLRKSFLKIKQQTMKFIFKAKGKKPENGYSLIFGFHGGGGCPAQVNDSQFRNHICLYDEYLPDGCIWFVPRSCENLPDMWHRPYLEDFLIEIIQAFTITKIVNPNKVFLTGYSAGGDGIYHMAPRMADWLAGAAMMAGHPNKVQLFNVRNIAFSIQVGAEDYAYNRNLEARNYIQNIEQLKEKYGGFQHRSEVMKNFGHWMKKRDAKIFPWLFSQTRDPYPNLIVFKQHPKRHKSLFYYIRIEIISKEHENEELLVIKQGNTFYIFSHQIITIMVNRKMITFSEPISIYCNGEKQIETKAEVNQKIKARTYQERLDPYFVFEDEFKCLPASTKCLELKQKLIKQKKNKIEQKSLKKMS